MLFVCRSGTDSFAAEATIIDPASGGEVEYYPGLGFPTKTGEYQQEWEVYFTDGKKQTFPRGTYNKFRIIEDLNNC